MRWSFDRSFPRLASGAFRGCFGRFGLCTFLYPPAGCVGLGGLVLMILRRGFFLMRLSLRLNCSYWVVGGFSVPTYPRALMAASCCEQTNHGLGEGRS